MSPPQKTANQCLQCVKTNLSLHIHIIRTLFGGHGNLLEAYSNITHRSRNMEVRQVRKNTDVGPIQIIVLHESSKTRLFLLNNRAEFIVFSSTNKPNCIRHDNKRPQNSSCRKAILHLFAQRHLTDFIFKHVISSFKITHLYSSDKEPLSPAHFAWIGLVMSSTLKVL